MKLGELFDKGEFVVTGEVGPVKGAIPRDENFCSVLGQRSETFEMMGRFIKKHKFKFQGVHIMPLGQSDVVSDILEQAVIQIKSN